METESSHGNQCSYLTGTKKKKTKKKKKHFFFGEANARSMYAKYQLHNANVVHYSIIISLKMRLQN